MRALTLFLLLSGCIIGKDADGDGIPWPTDCNDGLAGVGAEAEYFVDGDADGFGAGEPTVACVAPEGAVTQGGDCDDADADVSPTGIEVCDGIDNDCVGGADDGFDVSTWYLDVDKDGFGNEDRTLQACEQPDGYVAVGGDCDDADASWGAPVVYYADVDQDGYGNSEQSVSSCEEVIAYVLNGDDCDDTDAGVNPGALEACTDTEDLNCDGAVGFVDGDADGFAACEECNDGDATVFPGAPETCDDVDEDCDGEVDESAADAPVWYADVDADTFGDVTNGVAACDAPAGFVGNADDCDDAHSEVNPAATEACDDQDRDENCDGLAEDSSATGQSTWYADGDSDGYGNDATTLSACELPGGYSALGGDCDDGDAAFNPGASETDCADPTDYNCDGSTGYADADGDGYPACEECDDSRASDNPAAVESCDGRDNDCDATVDEADAVDATEWYRDADSDGYGDASVVTTACSAPSTYVADASDCNDANGAVNPGAVEVCDAANLDEDCDDLADDASASIATMSTFYADDDADTYGDPADSVLACDVPSGRVANDDDCNDTNAAISPADAEKCDGANVDEDCDNLADDADPSATGETTWYTDGDSDGYGGSTSTSACDAPANTVGLTGDCDDTDPAYNPGASEPDCDDPNDYNCDGVVAYADTDGDGVAACDDCNDADATVYPGADEYCDGADDDCDGTVDEADALDAPTWFHDGDGDGYGDASDAEVACSAPADHVADATDCNDANANVNPGESEACDAADTDEDCDGAADDDDSAATGKVTAYTDTDNDGYGTTASTWCDVPSGYADTAGDCDDADAAVSPEGAEVCLNDIDEDCSGDASDCGVGSADLLVEGEAVGQAAGTAVEVGTDLFGSGQSIVAGGVGAVWIFGPPVGSGTFVVGDADLTLAEESSGDDLGAALAVGDVSDAGFGDLLVTAPGADFAGADSGSVYILADPLTAATTLGDALRVDFTEGAGLAVTTCEYTADSSVDALFGEPGLDTAWLVPGTLSSGEADTLGFAWSGVTGTGSALACGNLIGVSSGDAVVAAAEGDGRVYVVFSGTGSDLDLETDADASLSGGTNDAFGASLALGDTDDDGYDDLLIGAPGDDDAGANAGGAWLVAGRASSEWAAVSLSDAVQFTGAAAGAGAGTSVAVADFDGDDNADVIVGTESGPVIVLAPFSGTVDLAAADVSVASAAGPVRGSDLDTDGTMDLLFGVPASDGGAGAVLLFYGDWP